MKVVNKDAANDLLKQITTLTRSKVLVGVPASKAARDPVEDAHGADQSINNAELAYIHDNGAPEANIPARPFMRPGIESAKAPISNAMQRGAKAALDGNASAVDQALTRAGIAAQTGIQEKITDGPFAPLKPATIARKGSDKPLIDTGQLRRSINFVVDKGQ